MPDHPNIRTKIDSAALVAGHVVRVWPTRAAFVILDAWLYCLPGDHKLAERIKAALLKKYGAIPSDDQQLNLKFDEQ